MIGFLFETIARRADGELRLQFQGLPIAGRTFRLQARYLVFARNMLHRVGFRLALKLLILIAGRTLCLNQWREK